MIALLLTITLVLGAADLEAGARAYRAGDFDEAYAHFAAARDGAEILTGEVLYDLGNCAFRRGRLAEAVLHYRRARLRMPHDDQVAFNLELAERRLGLEPSAPGALRAVVARSLDSIPPALLFAAIAVLHAIGVLGFVRRRSGPFLRVVMALLVLVSLGGAAYTLGSGWRATIRSGVVLAEESALRVAPRLDAETVQTLRAGEQPRVLEAEGEWLRLDLPEGAGWALRADVGIVD